jgi:hypothetical protein
MERAAWSALVYARTLEVDFRFIATPTAFAAELPYIEECVLTSTRVPEKLADQPRWSLFRTARTCVFGVTCTANDLVVASARPEWLDITRDKHGRGLYVFAGYVGAAGAPVPPYTMLNLKLFAPLYRYVVERWTVRPYDAASRTPIEVGYEWELTTDYPVSPAAAAGARFARIPGDLTDPGAVYLIPNIDNAGKAAAWNSAASRSTGIALCLGLSRARDALNSPLHIAAAPADQEGIVQPPPPPQPAPSTRGPARPEASTRQATTTPPDFHPEDTHRGRLKTTINRILAGDVAGLPRQMISWAQNDLGRAPGLRELWRGGERFLHSLGGWMQPSAPPEAEKPPQQRTPPQQRVPPQPPRSYPHLKKAPRPSDTADDASDKRDDHDSPWKL